MRSSWIIHYRLPVKPSVPLRGCRIQSLEGDTENQSPARNHICASRRNHNVASWIQDPHAVYLFCQSQFSDVVMPMEKKMYWTGWAQRQPVSLEFGILEQTVQNSIADGQFKPASGRNSWSSIFGVTEFDIIQRKPTQQNTDFFSLFFLY